MLRASAPIGSHPNKKNRSTMTSRPNLYQAAPELMKSLFALEAIGSDTDHAQLNAPDAAAPGAGEALVRVKAAGVTPCDARIRVGKSTLPRPQPLTLGPDISGVVEVNSTVALRRSARHDFQSRYTLPVATTGSN